MDFCLTYRGPLKSNGSKDDKHAIRQYLHPQLKDLWNQSPLKSCKRLLKPEPKEGEVSVIEIMNGFQFAPLVTSHLRGFCHLDILFLRPEEPGNLISTGGDIDNRIKTLFDALRYPHTKDEMPLNWSPTPEQIPFYCVLEDDGLITSVSVTCDRLLNPENKEDVSLIIHVKPKVTEVLWATMGLFGN